MTTYATYDEYVTLYYGDSLSSTNAQKWLSRASDEIDVLTFGRLQKNGLPERTYFVNQIKKACCAIADALYQIEYSQKAAALAMDSDGFYHGPVASLNSGKESISFTNGTSGSSIAKAASSMEERDNLINGIAVKYLANVPDATGINLLYAGVSGYV